LKLFKNILVTGSSGFIGSSFVQNYNAVYNISTFSLQSNRIENIDLKNIDIILHCAALVHKKKEHSFEKYHEINTLYPVELAKIAKAGGVKQFVFISTIAVFDESLEFINENSNLSPLNFYGKSKLDAEKKLIDLRDDNFKVSIIRAPMVYGRNAPGNIATLISLVKYFPIIPLGKINNKRSFVYIDNLCYLLNEVITQEKDGCFFAADDESISTSYLINQIAIGLNKRVLLIRIPFFECLIKKIFPKLHKRLFSSLVVDNKNSKKALSLENPVSVEEGIWRMLRND
jgi:nucleoside-diphosphate-sugar epimerase